MKQMNQVPINKLFLFLNSHEISCISGTQCTICTNYKSLKLLDQDIDHNLIKYFCKGDKTIEKIELKKLTSKSQRIHVIGNHWTLINSLKHRKFAFFCKIQKHSQKDSLCITDVVDNIGKSENKMVITQGYKSLDNLEFIDYLLIEKKYIKERILFEIPEKGYLVIDLKNGEKFYTCE